MDETSVTVTPSGSEYPLLRLGTTQDLLDIFRDNLGAAGLDTLDLPRVKVPSGGALSWAIGTLDGEESAKELEGIVLSWRPARLYWKKAIGEGGGRKPPDCTSRDGFIGVGDPGGNCAQCPFAQFGSATKGTGQACKQVRQLLLVRPGEILPHLISIPPTSLKAASQYFLMLLGRQMPYWGVTTKLRLERATNEAGINYAKVQFFMGRVLSPQERQLLTPFHEQMQQLLTPLAVDARDYTAEDPSDAAEPPFYAGPTPPAGPEGGDIPF